MLICETDGEEKRLEYLITTERHSVMALFWMKKLGITLDFDETEP